MNNIFLLHRNILRVFFTAVLSVVPLLSYASPNSKCNPDVSMLTVFPEAAQNYLLRINELYTPLLIYRQKLHLMTESLVPEKDEVADSHNDLVAIDACIEHVFCRATLNIILVLANPWIPPERLEQDWLDILNNMYELSFLMRGITENDDGTPKSELTPASSPSIPELEDVCPHLTQRLSDMDDRLYELKDLILGNSLDTNIYDNLREKHDALVVQVGAINKAAFQGVSVNDAITKCELSVAELAGQIEKAIIEFKNLPKDDSIQLKLRVMQEDLLQAYDTLAEIDVVLEQTKQSLELHFNALSHQLQSYIMSSSLNKTKINEVELNLIAQGVSEFIRMVHNLQNPAQPIITKL